MVSSNVSYRRYCSHTLTAHQIGKRWSNAQRESDEVNGLQLRTSLAALPVQESGSCL